MRRLVAVLIAPALVLSLAACGGGEAAQPATPTPGAAAPAAAAAGAATTLPEIANRSENETATFTAFPTGSNVPPDLMYKVTVEKQPTLIFFYDSTQNSSKEARKVIDYVRAENRGLVDLVTYDIGKYMTAAADGSVSVDPSLAKDANAKSAVLLARDPAIGVTFTPFIVLTDGQGYIIFKHRGLVDRKMLEREVQRASR
jgi:uncharacterized lipoprotein YehR (DUF1307 family)